jgi:hypothetical protein
MCAQFLIKSRVKLLQKLFVFILSDDFDPEVVINERIVPYKMASVIVSDGKNNNLKRIFIKRFSVRI